MSPDVFARLKICQKCICGWGCAPDPAGKLIAFLPRPLAGFGGRFAAGREMGGKERGREWKETEGKKTEGKGRKEGEGKGQEEREKDGRGKDGALKTTYSR